jgi:hypothetical protein
MKRTLTKNVVRNVFLLVLISPIAVSLAQTRPSPTVSAAQSSPQRRPLNTEQSPRPRLVVLIVVDQFRYDYLTRFGDLFTSRGIGRLMREGASWTDANFDHVPTFTAPGHAVFMTGAWPSQTGIVANDWYEQDTGRKVKSITDDATLMLAGKAGEKGKARGVCCAPRSGMNYVWLTTIDRK